MRPGPVTWRMTFSCGTPGGSWCEKTPIARMTSTYHLHFLHRSGLWTSRVFPHWGWEDFHRRHEGRFCIGGKGDRSRSTSLLPHSLLLFRLFRKCRLLFQSQLPQLFISFFLPFSFEIDLISNEQVLGLRRKEGDIERPRCGSHKLGFYR